MIGRLFLTASAAVMLGAATPSPDPYAAAPHVKWFLAQPFDTVMWPQDFGDARLTKTTVQDDFTSLSLAGASAEPVIPQRYYLKYDPLHHALAFQRGCCSQGEQGIETVGSEPPGGLPDADLVGVKTDRGIGIGSSLDLVIAVYGRPARLIPSTKPGHRGIVYRRSLAPAHPTCVRDTRILLDGSTVAGVSLLWSC